MRSTRFAARRVANAAGEREIGERRETLAAAVQSETYRGIHTLAKTAEAPVIFSETPHDQRRVDKFSGGRVRFGIHN